MRNSVFSLIVLCLPVFGQAPAAIAPREQQLGIAEYASGHTERAEAHFLRALSAGEQAGDPGIGQQVATLISLGRLYQAAHRFENAERVLTRARELALTLDSTNPRLTAIASSRLGGLYSASGDNAKAPALLHEAITRLRALSSPDLPELAWAYNSLGMAELRSGSHASAETDLRQAVSIATESPGEGDRQTAIYETNLGLALYFNGKYDRALPVLRRARFLLQFQADEKFGTALAELSAVEAALGKFALAEDDGVRALTIFEKQFPPGSGEIASAQVNLAAIYLLEHKTAAAAAILPEAVAAERRCLAGDRALADGIRWLAQLRVQQRDWDQAESLYREAIRLYDTQSGASDQVAGMLRREFVEVLKHEHGKPASPGMNPPA